MKLDYSLRLAVYFGDDDVELVKLFVENGADPKQTISVAGEDLTTNSKRLLEIAIDQAKSGIAGYLSSVCYPELSHFFSLVEDSRLSPAERYSYMPGFIKEALTETRDIRKLDRVALKMAGIKLGHMDAFENAVAKLNAESGEILNAVLVDKQD